MKRQDVQKRAIKMAIEIIKLTKLFPKSTESNVISYQIIKSSTSTAANYRASGKAKSTKDFIFKLEIVEEECDETLFWLEFSIEANLISQELVRPIINETSEILAIIISSIKTAKQKLGS